MIITSAKYFTESIGGTGIVATIDGAKWYVPLSLDNAHYAEIMRQVEAGELTIADAE